jgi:hypothetical protein|tara:strand:+ start:795 stop:1634 length:840 start_codon:yes stop_codon:yes gene_type:complete
MGTGGGAPTGDTAIRYQSEMPEVMGRKLGLMDQAVTLAKTGQAGSYNPQLPTQGVAGFSTQQQRAQDLSNQGVGAYSPFMQNASMLANKSVDPNAYKDFLNPYQSYVTQGIEDQFSQAENQANMQASQQGAFGGSRQGIQTAELANQRAQAVGSSLAQGYGQAQQTANQVYGQGAQQQAALGQQQQQMNMGDVSTLMQTGGQQQQLAQQGMDSQYRQQIQQMYEPYQRMGFVSDIFQGAPTSASSLAMATTPQANPLAQAVGAGITGLAAYQGFGKMTG